MPLVPNQDIWLEKCKQKNVSQGESKRECLLAWWNNQDDSRTELVVEIQHCYLPNLQTYHSASSNRQDQQGQVRTKLIYYGA